MEINREFSLKPLQPPAPPRPRPASRLLGDFTAFIKTRTLQRAQQQRGSSQDRFLLHSITGHRPRRTEHSCGKSLVFSPRQCCVSPVRVRGGGQRHGDRRPLLVMVTPAPSPSLTPPRPSRCVRCSARLGAAPRPGI